MRWLWILWIGVACAADFDCVFVGTSPIPVFEALYQKACGKSVLMVEQDEVCGGAWRGIAVCGMERVDLGCHQIGYTAELKEFLEVYAGCRVVPMDDPKGEEFKAQGLYFAGGCYELIENLMQLVEKMGVEVRMGCSLKSIYVDEAKRELRLRIGEEVVVAKQLFYTPMSSFQIENPPQGMKVSTRRPKYYHLYLLICDPTAPKFSYRACGFGGASRMMNLTYFLELEKMGRQMIVFQVNSAEFLDDGAGFLEELKKKGLVDPSAYILKAESHTYETGSAPQRIPAEWNCYFQSLQTSGFLSMTHHLSRWKEKLRPFREIVP